jgi:hypothetical protein
MLTGGNIKRSFCFYAGVAFFFAAIYCATSSDYYVRVLSVLWFVFGLISLAGVWANGLRSTDSAD